MVTIAGHALASHALASHALASHVLASHVLASHALASHERRLLHKLFTAACTYLALSHQLQVAAVLFHPV